MANTRRPRQVSGSFITRQVEDELLILDQDNEKVHQLNSTACKVWHACDGDNTVDRIITLMREQFDVDEQRLEADVRAVLNDLAALELIEYAE
ncbi:MAG: PqqD family protein [Cellvibrionaceae bacterium]